MVDAMILRKEDFVVGEFLTGSSGGARAFALLTPG